MKRALLVLAAIASATVVTVAGIGALAPTSAAAAPQTSAVRGEVAKLVTAARPTSEFLMMLRLNGSPTKLGTIVSAAGASTTNASTSTAFTIAAGETVMVYCDAAAACIEGSSASTTITNAAYGRSQPANEERFWIFKGTSAVTFACVGAAAFNCAVFRMD